MSYLLINGYSRSGSSILENILSSNLESISLGELNEVWKKGFIRNDRCSCGKCFQNCVFWGQVYDHYKKNKINFFKIEERKKQVDRHRYFLLHEIFKIKNKNYQKIKKNYKKDLQYLINIIRKISKKELIIDSSKNPAHANLINEIEDIKNIHIIRKIDGVINSYQKNIFYDDVQKKVFKKKSMILTFIEWTIVNILVAFLKYDQIFLEINKQDFNEKSIIQKLNFEKFFAFNQKGYHSISGNPVRFNKKNKFDFNKINQTKFNRTNSTILNYYYQFILMIILKINKKKYVR